MTKCVETFSSICVEDVILGIGGVNGLNIVRAYRKDKF